MRHAEAGAGRTARSVRALSAALLALAAWAGTEAPARAEVPLSGASRNISRSVVDSGGLLASAAGYLRDAVGEAVVARSAGASFRLDAGFVPMSAQPGALTSLVAVTKSTDNLTLSWTAPGLDGFEGDVLSGYYRIDASPDPLHVFAPTTFLTEFSTSVRPGQLQTYVLPNLQPNTTYYVRVYLSDARKAVAERSPQADEPTLANPPASPLLSGVFATSVTFTWALPAQGAEGFRIDGSSTAFGSLLPGGVLSSSMTRDGSALTLTVTGLMPDTAYYFRLGSLNWRDDLSFATLIGTRTVQYALPQPIAALSTQGGAVSRTISFTWSDPAYANRAGVLVLMSSMPITSEAVNGTSYATGQVLPDGSVVASTAAAASFGLSGLELDTTYYYSFYSRNQSAMYSLAVSTSIMLDLPPMAPAGLQAAVDDGRTAITLAWTGVLANTDGSRFKVSAAPRPVELARYDIYRATGIARANWVWVASAPVSATSRAVDIPDPRGVFYYKVMAKDAFPDTDAAMVADTEGNLYAVGPDQITRLKVPAASAGLLAGANPSGRPLLVRAVERPEDVGGKVVKSVRFEATPANSGEVLEGFRSQRPELEVSLRYEVQGGQVVASAFPGPRASAPTVAASLSQAVGSGDASRWLTPYWDDGAEYIKLSGSVDPADQTVTARTAMAGSYQIRTVYRASDFSFDLGEVSNKVITPNGDGLNDFVVFRTINPQASSVSGKIYDVRGAFVADMTPGTQVADSLVWDGRSNGRVVPRGVYIYQIKAEGKVFNGTVVVIR